MSQFLPRIFSIYHPAYFDIHYPYILFIWIFFSESRQLFFCFAFSFERRITFMVRFILAFASSNWQQYCGYEFQNLVRFCFSSCLPSLYSSFDAHYLIWEFSTSAYCHCWGSWIEGEKRTKKKQKRGNVMIQCYECDLRCTRLLSASKRVPLKVSSVFVFHLPFFQRFFFSFVCSFLYSTGC